MKPTYAQKKDQFGKFLSVLAVATTAGVITLLLLSEKKYERTTLDPSSNIEAQYQDDLSLIRKHNLERTLDGETPKEIISKRNPFGVAGMVGELGKVPKEIATVNENLEINLQEQKRMMEEKMKIASDGHYKTSIREASRGSISSFRIINSTVQID